MGTWLPATALHAAWPLFQSASLNDLLTTTAAAQHVNIALEASNVYLEVLVREAGGGLRVAGRQTAAIIQHELPCAGRVDDRQGALLNSVLHGRRLRLRR